MDYTISQAAAKMKLTAFTLRYYDKEGLLCPHRTEKGIRYFTEADMEQLEMLCCLKSTGMSIKEIKKYFDLCKLGDSTLEQRMEIFTSHREHILEKIGALQNNLNKIEGKIRWYSGYIETKREATPQPPPPCPALSGACGSDKDKPSQ